MLPLYDEHLKKLKTPYVTLSLIFVNVIIFAYESISGNYENIVAAYGVVPQDILSHNSYQTLFTSMFLHGNILHLVGNMWFLWLFGDNLEDHLGKIRFIIFYLATGIIAGVIHVFTVSEAMRAIPTIGASGAISGILGGYVVFFSHHKIRALIIDLFGPHFISIPAGIYIVLWFLYQILYLNLPSSIAYMAHIGGFVAGLILARLLKTKK